MPMKQPVTVYVPCDEHDDNMSGGYASMDGQSLCYVSEQQLITHTPEEWERVKKCLEALGKISNQHSAFPHIDARKAINKLNEVNQ